MRVCSGVDSFPLYKRDSLSTLNTRQEVGRHRNTATSMDGFSGERQSLRLIDILDLA